MHVEIDRVDDPDRLAALEAGLTDVLRDVREAVEDWAQAAGRARWPSSTSCAVDPPPLPADGGRRGRRAAGLARRRPLHLPRLPRVHARQPADGDGRRRARAVPGSGLGILRSDPPASPRQAAAAGRRAGPGQGAGRSSPRPTRARPCTGPPTSTTSSVKTFGDDGEVIGERRFLGLFSSAAYTESVTRIPVLRRKSAGGARAARLPRRRATAARRCSTCWRPTRATSCSRPRSTSWSRRCTRCCTCRSAGSCGCSCARTPTGATCPAWSTCRATATRRRCGADGGDPGRRPVGGRRRRGRRARRLHRPGERVGAGPAALRRAAAARRAGRRDRRAPGSSSSSATRPGRGPTTSPRPRTSCAARPRAPGWCASYGDAFPEAYKEDFGAAGGGHRPAAARVGRRRRRASACTCTSRPTRRPARAGSRSTAPARRCR